MCGSTYAFQCLDYKGTTLDQHMQANFTPMMHRLVHKFPNSVYTSLTKLTNVVASYFFIACIVGLLENHHWQFSRVGSKHHCTVSTCVFILSSFI